MECGPCGVLGLGGPRGKPRGRCEVHAEAWRLRRAQRAMQTQDTASCLVDRGQCGAMTNISGGAVAQA